MKNKERIKRLEERIEYLEIYTGLHRVCTPTDSLKMEEKPQPIEGVEFDCEGDKVYGVCKDELSLYYSGTNNLWAVLGGYTVNKPCHLVPVEKYTVGRVYKYRGDEGNKPQHYFLCIDYHESSKIYTAIAWMNNENIPITKHTGSAAEILEVQTI